MSGWNSDKCSKTFYEGEDRSGWDCPANASSCGSIQSGNKRDCWHCTKPANCAGVNPNCPNQPNSCDAGKYLYTDNTYQCRLCRDCPSDKVCSGGVSLPYACENGKKPDSTHTSCVDKTCGDFGYYNTKDNANKLAESNCKKKNRSFSVTAVTTENGLTCYDSRCLSCFFGYSDDDEDGICSLIETNDGTDSSDSEDTGEEDPTQSGDDAGETGNGDGEGNSDEPTEDNGSEPTASACYVCPTSSNSWEFSRDKKTTEWGDCWYFSNAVSCSGKYTPPVNNDDTDNNNGEDNSDNDDSSDNVGDIGSEDESNKDDVGDNDNDNNEDNGSDVEDKDNNADSDNVIDGGNDNDDSSNSDSYIEKEEDNNQEGNNTTSNPGTGDIATFVVLVLGITMFGYVVYYYRVLKDY